jgi:O-antigen/teichoic acid export membrane protein
MTLDQAAVALRQARVQLLRNLLFSGLKIAVLIALAATTHRSSLMIFCGWAASTWISVAYSYRRLRLLRGAVAFRTCRPLSLRLHWQHAISVLSAAPAALLPAIVAARGGPAEAARFYCAWMLASGVFMASPAVAQVLFAELSRDLSQRAAQVRPAVRLILGIGIAGAVGVLTLGPTVLAKLGPDYGRAAIGVLAVLIASAVPDAITNLAVAVKRADGRLEQAAAINAVIAGTCLLSAWWATPRLGALGAACGWLVGQSIGAIAVCGAAIPRRLAAVS